MKSQPKLSDRLDLDGSLGNTWDELGLYTVGQTEILSHQYILD